MGSSFRRRQSTTCPNVASSQSVDMAAVSSVRSHQSTAGYHDAMIWTLLLALEAGRVPASERNFNDDDDAYEDM